MSDDAVEIVARERDEALKYLKAFVRATIDPEDGGNDVGVHVANPTFGWYLQCAGIEENEARGRYVTGGQVRRAMELVGFGKLGIEAPVETISDEILRAEKRAEKAEATIAQRDATIKGWEEWNRLRCLDLMTLADRIRQLREALKPFADAAAGLDDKTPEDHRFYDNALVGTAMECSEGFQPNVGDLRAARAAYDNAGDVTPSN